MDLYLITGFLGAGKTTFLKNFVKLFKDKRIYLIVNEYGKEGVDGVLLREMNAHLSEINNGSIFCACRLDKFEEELVNVTNASPDVVIVEASGLSDPTNIRKVLDNPNYHSINYKGCVCLVDAARFKKVSTTARVVPKQISVSTLALINKTDLASEEQIESVKNELLLLNPALRIETTTFAEINLEWLNSLKPNVDMEYALNTKDITLQKATVTISSEMKISELEYFLKLIAEDTYRIKGFAKLEDKLLLIDCVGNYVKCSEHTGSIENINKIVVLAGPEVSLRKLLKKACEMYGGLILATE